MSLILSNHQDAATRRASALVLHASDLAHALLAEQMARFGITAPPRFMAGDEAADDQVDTEAEDVVEEDEPICHVCNGSGEGKMDGATCWACRGRGVLADRADEDDRRAAEADHLYDVAKDERCERGEG